MLRDMNLSGKGVLITGAAVRVGRAIALAAAQAGADVAIHYHRSAEAAARTSEDCKARGGRAVAVQADLTDPGQVARMVAQVAEGLGSLWAVVNSASVFYRTPLEEVTDRHWKENLDVHVMAPWWVTRAALPHMRRLGSGRVVNIVDWAAEKPYTEYLPYVVSKAGLLCMTRALAKELAPDITVNAVAPGPMLPGPELDEEARRRIARRVPLKRWGTPEDVAAAVMFFLAATDYATGSVLHVDGGSLIS